MLPLLHPRPAPPYRCSTWLSGRGPRCPGRGRRRPPPEARPQRIGPDLDHRTGRSVQPSRSTVSGQTAPVSDVDTPRPHGLVMDARTVASSQPGSDAGLRRWSPALRGAPAAAPPPLLSARLRQARRSVRPGVALRPQGPLGRCAVSTRTGHGVHSDRRGVLSDRWVSTRTGSGSLPAHRKGPAVCGAPVWPRATRRARRRGGRC
jgi:hypothetical protein